jgi:beta-lactamase class A
MRDRARGWRRRIVAVALPGLWAMLLTAGAAPELPLDIPDDKWRPLYESSDPELLARLEAMVAGVDKWNGLAKRKKLAIGIVDLTDPEQPRFAAINGNQMMYAASLAKIAILLAAFQSIEDGLLPDTPELRKDLNAMIRVSSNAAATRNIDRIGLERIQAVLTDPRYRLYDRQRGGGLWVGKRYGKTLAPRRDPLHGLSHGATVTQVCRFYYLLATGRAVSPARSREMLEILSHPGLHHKFVHAYDQRAPRVSLFRKSGTYKQWHSDSVIAWGQEWRRYILTVLVESESGEKILRDIVPAVENVLRPPGEAGE